MRRWVGSLAMFLVAATLVGPSSVASAGTFPGANGKIAFSSYDGADWEIFTMDWNGSNVTQLTFNSVEDRAPSWDATGNEIA